MSSSRQATAAGPAVDAPMPSESSDQMQQNDNIRNEQTQHDSNDRRPRSSRSRGSHRSNRSGRGEMLDDHALLELLHSEEDDVSLMFNVDSDEEEEEEDDDGYSTDSETTPVTTDQLYRLLGAEGLRRILQTHGLWTDSSRDDGDDEALVLGTYGFRRRKKKHRPNLYPKVPSEAGAALMASGQFGSNPFHVDRRRARRNGFSSNLMWRELGRGPRGADIRATRSLPQGMIPTTAPDKIIHFPSRSYSGQFSDDGDFFFSCAQDFRVRLYDTSNPCDWKFKKTISCPFGQWTITDACLSPSNQHLACSSITSLVHLTDLEAKEENKRLFDLDKAGPVTRDPNSPGAFGVWSLRFSGNGKELVAGTSNRSVIVYDIEAQKPVLRVQSHEDDVNAVCFADKSSPHIIYSGSDDTTIRVWDRRSMGDGREAGVFLGHTEGITFVDSKGDGRYVLSNGKDQQMKLWDLRKMITPGQFDTIDPSRYSTGFDYRFMPFSEQDYSPHPYDCSVVSYRGHSVLKTLIRCHFSPPNSTNSRYVYTGSEDGNVYIYNLDATLAGKIDVAEATYLTRPPSEAMYDPATNYRRLDNQWRTVVRDASWHPDSPVLAATSWNGWGMTTGTCTVHSWNDGAPEHEGGPPSKSNFTENLVESKMFNHYAYLKRGERRGSRIRNRPNPGDWRSYLPPAS